MASLAAAIQLVQWCQQAGFTGTSLASFVSIGLCESGGDPSVLNNNPNTGDYSCGLFQINYYGNLYAGRTAAFGPPPANAPQGVSHQPTQSGIMNPVNNAAAAYSLSNGGKDMSPWQADFDNGNYYVNLPTAQQAIASVATTSTGAYTSSVGNAGGSSGNASDNAQLTSYTGDAAHEPVLQFHTGWAQNIPGVPGTITLLNHGQVQEILGIGCMLGGAVIAVVGLAVLFGKKPKVPMVWNPETGQATQKNPQQKKNPQESQTAQPQPAEVPT